MSTCDAFFFLVRAVGPPRLWQKSRSRIGRCNMSPDPPGPALGSSRRNIAQPQGACFRSSPPINPCQPKQAPKPATGANTATAAAAAAARARAARARATRRTAACLFRAFTVAAIAHGGAATFFADRGADNDAPAPTSPAQASSVSVSASTKSRAFNGRTTCPLGTRAAGGERTRAQRRV